MEILRATPEKDPILELWRRLHWAESESVNLLIGFRGNGKSTELRRLKKRLEEQSGAKAFLVDMADFLSMNMPPEISDFVLSLTMALGHAVEVDSVEQIRGVGTEATRVHDNVMNLFAGHAGKLRFPMLHVVYTIPPYLLALSQNLGRAPGGQPIVSWPNVHVRDQEGADDDAAWLTRIHTSKDLSLKNTSDLATLARFFDGNLIMNYLNGEPWYDIHSLIGDEIHRDAG